MYTPALKVKLPLQWHTSGVQQALLSPKGLPKMEDRSAVLMESGAANGDEDSASDGEDGLSKMVNQQEKGYLDEYEDDRQLLLFKQDWDSEGEDELSEAEAGILFQVTKLAMEQDGQTSDSNAESDEDSNIDDSDSDSDSDSSSDYGYIPDKIQGSCRCAPMSKPSKRVNTKAMSRQAAKDDSMQKNK